MFPDVSEAFWGLTSPVVYKLVRSEIVDHKVEKSETPTTIEGIMEPLSARQLAIKPEGQRNWKWWTMWTTASLFNGDIVVDPNGTQFQVQGLFDWRAGGYSAYELTEKPV